MPFLLNVCPERGAPLLDVDRASLGKHAFEIVDPYLDLWPSRAVTELHHLAQLARELDLECIYVKDEGTRLGLGSFKALGGAYAVARLVHERARAQLGRRIAVSDLKGREVRKFAQTLTVCCATDGNHGRSVAAGAKLIGCNAVIFVHAGVSEARIRAIAAFGARIIRTEGSYDESVDEAAATSAANGWHVVSDTA